MTSRGASIVLVAIAGLAAACSGSTSGLDGGREVDAQLMALCLAPSVPGTSGAPCRCTTDCASAFHCSAEPLTGFPGGLCSRECTSAADCPGGGCTATGGTAGFCRATCDAAGSCAGPAVCAPAVNLCLPRCAADGDCESGRCNRWSGDCLQPGQEPAGLLTDATCAQDTDCRSGLCGPESACISTCSTDRGGCPDGELCLQPDSFTVHSGFCTQLCTSVADCRGRGRGCLAVRGMPGVRACQ